MDCKSRQFLPPIVAACSALLLTSASAQTVLVDEDWQTDPLESSGTQATGTIFPGWTFGGGARTRNSNNWNYVPEDPSVTDSHGHNQVIQMEQTSSELDYNISHNWASTDTYYLRVEASPMSWSGQSQRYVRPELRQQDDTVLWSTSQDASTTVPLYSSYIDSLTDHSSEFVFHFEIDASAFSTGTEGQPLKLRIDSSGARGLIIGTVTLVLGPLPADSTAPVPDPPTWDILPNVSDFTTISLRANSVEDANSYYGVEYYFENTTNATNSGWQRSREWSQTGLDYSTEYTYRVKTRDLAPTPNESGWSSSQSATTDSQDLTPPSPDPLTWNQVPTIADYRSITMSVNAASDPSGVEYYFENVTAGTNSGWITSNAWTDKDLDPDTQYTYRARARDQSPDVNVSTTWSATQNATTPTEPANTLFITRFQDPLINDNTGNPDLGDWVLGGGNSANIKIQKATGDGVRTDTDLSTPGDNRVVQFEYIGRYIEYNIDHNWSASDTFTLTINASPQSWNGSKQRYIRPSILQQDNTVLWAPGENMTGPEKTAIPLWADIVGNSFQDDANTSFSFTIDASAFSGGTEGQPVKLRINSSGEERGVFFDNVHLSLVPDPYNTWAASYSLTGGDELKTANTDGDTLTQLQEWAFGTNPNVSDSVALTVTDASTFSAGTPMVATEYTGGNPIKLRYVRRKDHATVGLTYTPEFTDSLAAFSTDPNNPTPSVVSDAGGDYEVVEVPYPLFDSTGKKATSLFGRVVVSED